MELDSALAWLARVAEWSAQHWQVLAIMATVWLILIMLRGSSEPR